MSTLLEIVQTFTQRQGLPVPATVMGSLDAQVVQYGALLQEGLESISARGAWQELVKETTWVTTATEDQGAITTLAPGFRYLKVKTLWDRTQKLPLLGPTDGQDWQALKAIVVTGPRYSFRIRGDHFLTTPAPPAGHTWAFEYLSENFLVDAGGTVYKSAFTLDTDNILLPKQIVLADLRWRWKKEKGLTYAEDFNSAEAMIADALGRDGGSPDLDMAASACNGDILPGVWVPSGSWF